MQNEDINDQDPELQALLKDYPVPRAAAGFYDQALLRATHTTSRQQRNRWLAAGFADRSRRAGFGFGDPGSNDRACGAQDRASRVFFSEGFRVCLPDRFAA
jgi:hypothetical protein